MGLRWGTVWAVSLFVVLLGHGSAGPRAATLALDEPLLSRADFTAHMSGFPKPARMKLWARVLLAADGRPLPPGTPGSCRRVHEGTGDAVTLTLATGVEGEAAL